MARREREPEQKLDADGHKYGPRAFTRSRIGPDYRGLERGWECDVCAYCGVKRTRETPPRYRIGAKFGTKFAPNNPACLGRPKFGAGTEACAALGTKRNQP